ncbi:hypothetical protein SAMN05443634_1035 [Chishuiella changwenlii]|uniref:Uncharacterized protein n=1 Tax=Chishuiella changwenlii TaxID=1434701 RepID=A0A1M6UPM6_9FLAO|nr:hypothetical protein GCM10010984_30580 [Chishuiella changwenlii]SHK71113.1 hypothetical protein SAMN05443634_1035 [Chishuiella changwenlii]
MGFFKKIFGYKNEIQKTHQNISSITLNRISWSFSTKFYVDSEEFNKDVFQILENQL